MAAGLNIYKASYKHIAEALRVHLTHTVRWIHSPNPAGSSNAHGALDTYFSR